MPRSTVLRPILLVLAALVIPLTLRAQTEELDNTKWKLYSTAWISMPTGYFNGKRTMGTSTCSGTSGLATMPPSAADWTGASSASTTCCLAP